MKHRGGTAAPPPHNTVPDEVAGCTDRELFAAMHLGDTWEDARPAAQHILVWSQAKAALCPGMRGPCIQCVGVIIPLPRARQTLPLLSCTYVGGAS